MSSSCWAGTRARAQAAVVAAGMGFAACSNQAEPPPGSQGALGTAAAELDRDVFLPGCAFAACHGAARPAAHLDLSGGLCDAQLERASCLFPGKRLVVPGRPDLSFLVDKLSGDNLAAQPDTDCSTTGNARMPYGAAPLSPATIERVRTWIRGGALCATPAGVGGTSGASGTFIMGGGGGVSGGGATGGDGGGTGGVGGAAPGGDSWRLTFEPTTTVTVRAGARATLTLVITPPAGAAGLSVTLATDDAAALGVPGAVFVPAGSDRVALDVQGKRPNPAVWLTATAGQIRVQKVMAVDGLFLAEVFYGNAPLPSPGDHSQWVKVVNISDVPIDLGGYQVSAGRGNATDTTLPLTGLLQPGACATVGGGASGSIAGDFVPDLPRVDALQPGVAVVLGQAGAAVTLDAVVAGGSAVTLGPDGTALAPAAMSVAAGHGLARSGSSTWLDQARPSPGECRRWW